MELLGTFELKYLGTFQLKFTGLKTHPHKYYVIE